MIKALCTAAVIYCHLGLSVEYWQTEFPLFGLKDESYKIN